MSLDRLVLIARSLVAVQPLQQVLLDVGYEVRAILLGSRSANAETQFASLIDHFLPHLVVIHSLSASGNEQEGLWQRVYQGIKTNPHLSQIPLLVLGNSSIDLLTAKQLAKQGVMFLSSPQVGDVVSAIEVQLERMRLKARLKEGSGYLLPCPECQLWQNPHGEISGKGFAETPLGEVQRIAHLGSWEWQQQTQEIRGSREFYRMLGIEPQPLNYPQVLKRIHPEHRRQFYTSIETAIAKAIPQDLEVDFYSEDGHLRYGEVRIQPILGMTGETIGLFGILLDVGDRKLLEQKIQTSEMEMRSVFSAMLDIVLVLDTTAETIKMIPTGITLGDEVELVSETIDRLIYGEQRDQLIERLQTVVTNKIPITFDYDLELDQRKIWFSTTLSPMAADQVIWIGRNVTQRKQVELERDRALQQAQAANQAKSQFLANMSHELRTPLNAILGFTQVLLRDVAITSQIQHPLEIIYRSGEHLLGLINNVLDLSKVESGYLRLNLAPMDIEAFLDTLYQMLSLKAQAKGIELQVEKTTRLPRWLITDEGKLRQILINLLGNAIKFTEQGKVILRIAYHPAATDSRLEIEVEDTGAGIAPEEIPLLFQPFQQTAAGLKSQEGTGLGLSICDKFVTFLGGELKVSSQINRGTIFGFQIPVAERVSGQDDQERDRRVRGFSAPVDYQILVVEDRWENQEWLMRLLQGVGFGVLLAGCGAEAIAQWEQYHPDLILMDLRLAQREDYQTIQQIRATPEGRNLPIIALTAITFENEEELIAAAGYNRLLRKPLQDSILFATLAQYLSLEYIYEAQKSNPETSSFINSDTIDCTPLSTMSAEWVHEMYEATVSLDDQRVVALLEALPSSRGELIEFFHQKLHQFDFESILDLIIPLLPDAPVPPLEWEA